MTEKIHILLLSILCAALMMLVSFCSGWTLRGKQMEQQTPTADTTITTTTDTATLVGTDGLVDSVVWKPYPVPVPYPVHDTAYITNTDTQYVYLPYEYKHLSKPDTLDIWYSGIDPKIDSTILYYHHTTEIIKQPYEVYKMPRLTAEIGVTAFYSQSKVNPYLVGEMRYNARKTTFSAYGFVNHEGVWGAGGGVTYRINLIK